VGCIFFLPWSPWSPWELWSGRTLKRGSFLFLNVDFLLKLEVGSCGEEVGGGGSTVL
jgi:hypothetical protein